MLELVLVAFIANKLAWFLSYSRQIHAGRRRSRIFASDLRELAKRLLLERGKLELAEAECEELRARLDELRRSESREGSLSKWMELSWLANLPNSKDELRRSDRQEPDEGEHIWRL